MMFGIGIGWSSVFALPFAVSVEVDDDGDRWIALHVGPILIEFAVERS